MAAKPIDELTNPYGFLLRKLRESRGSNQKSFSGLVGISASTLRKVETDESVLIDQSTSEKINNALIQIGIDAVDRRRLRHLEISRVKTIDVDGLAYDDIKVLVKLAETYRSKQSKRGGA